MSNTNLVMRNDTILGVCQGLGEDFGFNPNILRIALILPIFWFPAQMLAIYLGLGLVVAASRLLFRTPSADKAAASEPILVKAVPVKEQVQVGAPELRDAA